MQALVLRSLLRYARSSHIAKALLSHKKRGRANCRFEAVNICVNQYIGKWNAPKRFMIVNRVLQSFCPAGRSTSRLSLQLTPAVVSFSTLASPTKTRPTKVDKYSTSQVSSRLGLVARHLSSSSTETSTMSSSYGVTKVYAPNTLKHRVYITDENRNAISPFHDIPLYTDDSHQYLNMVVEIPRWTNGKLEVSQDCSPSSRLVANPIIHRFRKKNH